MDTTKNHPPLGTARRDYQTFRRLVIALLVIASAAPLALNIVDPDLWGHVRYAEEWIAEGELPRTATHTFTAKGHPWINHENLAELALAYGFRTLGVKGMLAAKVVLGMTILILMSLAARRQGVRPITAWVCLLLIAHNLQAFFPLRPQLLSFLWCAVMLLALDRAFAGWGNRRSDFRNSGLPINRRKPEQRTNIDWRWLCVLPPLFAVWVNSHGGFVAGLAILFAVLLGRTVELYARMGKEAGANAIRLAAIAAASGLATLANPYGLGLHAWLAGSLGEARPEITEWAAPTPDNPVFWPFVILVAVAVIAFATTDRRRDPVKMVILAIVGWQAATHLRHIAFFALLCGFWVPTHVQSLASRLRNQAASGLPTASLSPWMRYGVGGALALAIALQATFLGKRLATLPVSPANYPVDAFQWMADHNVRGDVVVCFNWAQYAIAALAPDVRVAFDGRFRTCYPQEVIDRHFDFLVGDNWPRHRSPESGEIDGTRTLTEDRPDYVLVDRIYPHAVEVMEQTAASQESEWLLVYQDATARLYGRRSVVDDPESSRYVPTERRFVSQLATPTPVEWPALPRRSSIAIPYRSEAVAKREATPTNQVNDEG